MTYDQAITETMNVVKVIGIIIVFLCCWHETHSLSTQDAMDLQRRLLEIVSYVHTDNRTMFYKTCVGTVFSCNPRSFSPQPGFFQWREGITHTQKERFWQTYHCISRVRLSLCPVDGEWSLWSAWTRCNAPCKSLGDRTRERLCNNPTPTHKGIPCVGQFTQLQLCTGACSNGSVSGYDEVTESLSAIHHSLPQLKAECLMSHCNYDDIAKYMDHSRRDRYWSHLMCYKHKRACPVDGGWSQWGNWSDCSVPCGNGYQYRHRTCSTPTPLNGGEICEGDPTDRKMCVAKNCQHIAGNERAVMTEWSDFGACSVTCGSYGIRQSKRTCLLKNSCVLQNNAVETLTMEKPCFMGACPEIGGWSMWSEWTECSAMYGSGRKTRLRLCTNPYPSGGLSCVGKQVDTIDCIDNATTVHRSLVSEDGNAEGFHVDESGIQPRGDPYSKPFDLSKEGHYKSWSQWSLCSHSCGGGYRSRHRSCRSRGSAHCAGEVRQIQFCNTIICPENGGWSEWSQWSICDKTCDSGQRHRYRQCDNPPPARGGMCPGSSENVQACNTGNCINSENRWSDWSSWSECSKSCGEGETTRSRTWIGTGAKDTQTMRGYCNPNPCDSPGSWGMWGQWSECSSTCNLGHHYRERTCTDPAPVNNGKACRGPGTEVTYCYHGPCVGDEPAITFTGQSFSTYSTHNKHARYLLVYLRVLPEAPSGALFYRYRGCKDETWECKHVASLTLDTNWFPVLHVEIEGEKLRIRSTKTLKGSVWNDVQVGISRDSAYIRVNDFNHTTKDFKRTLPQEVDFDANMVLGAEKNGTRGFTGSMSMLRVNFKDQALMQTPYWLGPGSPDRQVMLLQYNSTDNGLNYPDFRGKHYIRLWFKHTAMLDVMFSVKLQSSSGLLVYNEGAVDGSYVTLSLEDGALHMCFVCGVTTAVCESGDVLQVNHWYFISLKVEGTEARLRVNRGRALQATCLGRQYRPKTHLYLGGVPASMWTAMEYMGISKGFDGNVEMMVANGETFAFKRAGLYNFNGNINSMGYTIAAHVSEVIEHSGSRVTLRCDYTNFTTGGQEAVTRWLIGDVNLNSTEGTEIVPRLPGLQNESSVTLMPDEHQEGMYACLVDQGGRLLITHMFPLFRVKLSMTVKAPVEWSIIIALIVFVTIVFVVTITVMAVKRDTMDHLKDMSLFSKDLKNRDGQVDLEMDGLSVIHEEGEEGGIQNEGALGSDEDGEEVYTVQDISEHEGEEEDDDENEEKDERALSRLGSVVANKLIEENKERVLELIASMGSINKLQEVSSRLSNPSKTSITRHNVNASAVRMSRSMAQRASSSQTLTSPMYYPEDSSYPPMSHMDLISGSRHSQRTTTGPVNIPDRNTSPRESRFRGSDKITDPIYIPEMNTSASPPLSPTKERLHTLSHSVGSMSSMPTNRSYDPSSRRSDYNSELSAQSVPSLDTRSSRSSRSPSPRRSSSLQPGSPRKLSLSISPPVGADAKFPPHIQPKVRIPVLPTESPSPEKPKQEPGLSPERTLRSGFSKQISPSNISIRARGLFNQPSDNKSYCGLDRGISAAPIQPFGAVQLDDIQHFKFRDSHDSKEKLDTSPQSTATPSPRSPDSSNPPAPTPPPPM